MCGFSRKHFCSAQKWEKKLSVGCEWEPCVSYIYNSVCVSEFPESSCCSLFVFGLRVRWPAQLSDRRGLLFNAPLPLASERYMVPWNLWFPWIQAVCPEAGRRRGARHINSTTTLWLVVSCGRRTCCTQTAEAKAPCVVYTWCLLVFLYGQMT